MDTNAHAEEATTRPLLTALGAVLAGGASRRFGTPKALSTIGGRLLSERVAGAVSLVVTQPVVITADRRIASELSLPSRPDATPGLGPAGGVCAALRWADELGLAGALCVACDLPFIAPSLLREIVEVGLESRASIVPESYSHRGVEPLCAWYALSALPLIVDAMNRGERSMHAIGEILQPRRLPLERVALHGDPRVLFLNVNTPDAARDAETIIQSGVTGV